MDTMICVESMSDKDVKGIIEKNTIEKLMTTTGLCHCPGCKQKLKRVLLEIAVEGSSLRL